MPVSRVLRLGATVSDIDTKPGIVHCRAFNDCQKLGDWFKSTRIVDMFLDQASEQDRRRITDFASGMVYVAGGTMQKIAPQRFRLTNPSPRGLRPGGRGETER